MSSADLELSRLEDYLHPKGIPNMSRLLKYIEVIADASYSLTEYDLKIWGSILKSGYTIFDTETQEKICFNILKRGLKTHSFKELNLTYKLIENIDLGIIHKVLPDVDNYVDSWNMWSFFKERGIETKLPEYQLLPVMSLILESFDGKQILKHIIDAYPQHKEEILNNIFKQGILSLVKDSNYKVSQLGLSYFEYVNAYPDISIDALDVNESIVSKIDRIRRSKDNLISILDTLDSLVESNKQNPSNIKLILKAVDSVGTAILNSETKERLISSNFTTSLDSLLSSLAKLESTDSNIKITKECRGFMLSATKPEFFIHSGVLQISNLVKRDKYWEAISKLAPPVFKNNIGTYLFGRDQRNSITQLEQQCSNSPATLLGLKELYEYDLVKEALLHWCNTHKEEDTNFFKEAGDFILNISESDTEFKLDTSCVKKLSVLISNESTWDWPLWDNPYIKAALIVTYMEDQNVRNKGWTNDVINVHNPVHPILRFLEHKTGISDLSDQYMDCLCSNTKYFIPNLIGRLLFNNQTFSIENFIKMDELINTDATPALSSKIPRIFNFIRLELGSSDIKSQPLPELTFG